jgi:hypothetical protein
MGKNTIFELSLNFCQSQFYSEVKMDSTEENNNKALSADMLQDGQTDYPECEPMGPQETGHNELVMQAYRESYAYCVTEETVSGMHLAQGKPRQADQMNV